LNPLIIEQTDISPKVILDDGQQIFLFEGESRPESASKFFRPIITWLEEYKNVLYWQKNHYSKNPSMTVQFRLNYFNSTSAKFIGDILTLLNSFCKEGYDVHVRWFYQPEDVDMKESAEEYMQLCKQLPIEQVPLDNKKSAD